MIQEPFEEFATAINEELKDVSKTRSSEIEIHLHNGDSIRFIADENPATMFTFWFAAKRDFIWMNDDRKTFISVRKKDVCSFIAKEA